MKRRRAGIMMGNKQLPYEQLSINKVNNDVEDQNLDSEESITPPRRRQCSFNKKLLIILLTLISLSVLCIVLMFTINAINSDDNNNKDNSCKDSCCIFCYGSMLQIIQEFNFFNDSKYFVDMEMKEDPSVILKQWNQQIIEQNQTLNSSAVYDFTISHFSSAGNDITSCIPVDYNASINLPKLLSLRISDNRLISFASSLYKLWQYLCKNININVYKNPSRHSLLPLPHSQMIVAGGRFREVYYWDSYWIIHGLLVSNMSISAKQTVDNLINLTATYGHMLNGNRIYYQNRSQPPLLTFMVDAIYEFEMRNNSYILNNIKYLNILKSEYLWWMNTSNKQVITINNKYKLNLYYIDSSSARPEGYMHDEKIINDLKNDSIIAKNKIYSSLRSGAESGMDYSSRWCLGRFCNSNLTNIDTINVIPVELNAYLYFVEVTLAKLFGITGNNQEDVLNFTIAATNRLNAINNVLWDNNDKKWRDYDLRTNKQININGSESITSYIPLWLLPYNESIGIDVLTSFANSSLLYIGGVSTTSVNDSQQWDYPNAWPPIQWIIAKAAQKYNNTQIGNYLLKNITQTYINAAFIGLNISHYMHEKYNVHHVGSSGNGGFYKPQKGFGWSNGVALSFLYDYGNILKHPDIPS